MLGRIKIHGLVRNIILVVFAFGFLVTTIYAESTKSLALFISRSEGDAFWGPVVDFTQAACDNLGMNLKVYYADSNLIKMRRQVKKVARSKNPPDAIIVHNFIGVGISVLKEGEKAKVPVFLFNSGVDYKKAGKPREKFKYWIGDMLPDDEGAGYDLANFLVDKAKKNKKTGPDGKVHVLGIEGKVSAAASILRKAGLERAMKKRNDAILHQIVPANWSQDEAKSRFLVMKKRYPHISVAWAASDLMSIGVTEAVKSLSMKPNKDIFTGGVDWAKPALDSVNSGIMTATGGGHFMEGGWVAVLLYDYLHGIDFAKETVMMRSKQHLLHDGNIGNYLKHFGGGDWGKIDFKQFSKKLNPKIKKYKFGLNVLMEQFQ